VTFDPFQVKMSRVRLEETNRIFAMVIKGTVHNGQITFESSTLPEGTQVLITPIQSLNTEVLTNPDLIGLKNEIHRIASLACENDSNDGFSGVDHDKVLYGN
jgi:hypothetical protein